MICLCFQLHEFEQTVNGFELKNREAEERVIASEKSIESTKIHCNEEIQKVRDHSKQLSEQNTVLHKEIEKVCKHRRPFYSG